MTGTQKAYLALIGISFLLLVLKLGGILTIPWKIVMIPIVAPIFATLGLIFLGLLLTGICMCYNKLRN